MNAVDWLEETMREIDAAGEKCPKVVGWALASFIEELFEIGEGYPEWMKDWAGDKLDGTHRFAWADEMED
jgi:hypothetical protein